MTAITPDEFGIDTDRGASTLSRIRELDGYIAAMEAERTTLKDALRLELTSDPTPIVDGEHGLVAVLRERNRPASIDLASMAEHPDLAPLIAEAARAGVLFASLTAVRSVRGKTAWADALLRYEMPGGVSYVLTIEEAR